MRSPKRPVTAVEPADSPVGSAARSRHLSVAPDPDEPRGSRRTRILDQLTSHIGVARELGVEPLTVAERAAAMLDGACEGWRTSRQCTTDDGIAMGEPHAACLRAQYHHDVLLLEHGLLRHERTGR